MTKLNQIQQALVAIDPAGFQKLCDLIISRQPRYKDLKPLGSVLGADKTSTGVPDSLIVLPEGGYAFAAYTTESTHAKLVAKLHADLADCFDEAKTDIPASEVREVFLYHTGRLTGGEIHDLIEYGKTRNCVVHPGDLHELSLYLYQKDPGLARDQLAIDVDTGQLLSPADWVAHYNKSSFATRLDTTFHFREAELGRALEALERCDLVIVSGAAGVGKSRLMLEVGARFVDAHSEFSSVSVYHRGANIYDDVRAHFAGDGHYLIFIDDANRLTGALSYFLQLLPEQTKNRRIKILATVREYALDKVRASLDRDGIREREEVPIERLTDEQIKALVSSETTINNPMYLDRISRLAQGNPRLAMMAADVARKANTLESIANAESLYEEYFRSIRDDIELLSNAHAIKVAGIIAFLRTVDRSNEALMSLIAAAFDVSPQEFWTAAEELHERELLDMYETEVVRFSDQVLATYLFAYSVFRRKLLPLAAIFAHFFPQHRPLIVDALNPALEAFGASLIDDLRPQADALWASATASGDNNTIEELIRLFWFIKQTETLRYIQNYIASLEAEPLDVATLDFQKSSGSGEFPLSILGRFVMPERVEVALALVCEFALKRPSALPAVLHVLCHDFGFRPYNAEYALQRSVLEGLWTRAENGRHAFFARLYLGVATAYLRTDQRFSESGGKMTINVITFMLPRTPALTELRRGIFEHLATLSSLDDLATPVLNFIDRYAGGAAFMAATETITDDSQHLLPIIAETFTPDDPRYSEVAHKYFAFLRRTGITVPVEVQRRFDTPAAVLRQLLAPDFTDRAELSLDEFRAWQRERLADHCGAFSHGDYYEFFVQAATVQPAQSGHGRWQFDESIGYVFEDLEGRQPTLFVDVVAAYLDLGNPLAIIGYGVMQQLIARIGVGATEDLLRAREYQHKERWLFSFYAYIPATEITVAHLEALLHLYRTAAPEEIPRDFRYLEKYQSTNAGALATTVEIILGRQGESFLFRALLEFLFMPDMVTSGLLFSSFPGSQLATLKAAYFAADAAHAHMDHDGHAFNAILDVDRHFLHDALEHRLQVKQAREKRWLDEYDDERNYDFLWHRDDYEVLMRTLLQDLFQLATGDAHIYVHHYLKIFFGLRHLRVSTHPVLLSRRLSLLRALVTERSQDTAFMQFISAVVGDLPDDEKRELIATFLQSNQQPKDFKRLGLLPSHHTWTGSAVPMIQREMEFLETLLPLVNTVALLEQRAYLEQRIAELREWADGEKRSDFLKDL